jgi:hypothetical protein
MPAMVTDPVSAPKVVLTFGSKFALSTSMRPNFTDPSALRQSGASNGWQCDNGWYVALLVVATIGSSPPVHCVAVLSANCFALLVEKRAGVAGANDLAPTAKNNGARICGAIGLALDVRF